MTKRPTILTIAVISLAVLTLALTVQSAIRYATPKLPAPQTAVTLPRPASAPPAQPRAGLPVRLQIPAINVDASIEALGLTPDGAMAITPNLANVAWYKLGERPGDVGSAVIAGHYGGSSLAAVFNHLHELKPGDKLFVQDATGASITFVIRGSQNYDPKADASSIFQSHDGQSHLNLITCEGVWNKATKSYTNRLVVFTDKS